MKSKYKRTKFKFTKNVHSLLFLLVISLLAPSVFLFTAGDEKGKELSVFSTNVIDSIDYPEHSLAAINESEYSQLASVGNVIDYPVSNSVATAVLIEQTHKYPNSNSSDKINDDAEATQGQILGILDKLHNEDDIDILLN